MKDISNIFNLPQEELDKKCKSAKSLWSDTAPQIKDFATNLSKFILKIETPYVLALDGAYGTGKTHFSTRFSLLLNKSIRTVYFSAWEHDYMIDPFLVLSEKIIGIIRQNGKEKGQIAKILESIAKATKVRAEFGFWGMFKIEAELSGKELLNKVFPEKQRSELFLEMKQLLAEFIQSLPKRKLVFIVDELDRCRPDYAVKILETIKHFFDIPGLVFILPINLERLNIYVQGFYNIDISTSMLDGKEDYLQKFINETLSVPKLNYNKICDDKIKPSEFGQHISDIEGKFNSIHELKKWIAEYAQKANLSYRETIEIIKRAKHFCKNYHEPIRCRLLANKLCNKIYEHNNKNSTNINVRMASLGFGNDYSYIINGNSESKKDTLLKAEIFNHNTLLQFGNRVTTTNVETISKRISSLQKKEYSYANIYSTIDSILEELNKMDTANYMPPYTYYATVSKKELCEKIKEIKDYLLQTKSNLLAFQDITGSDDNDRERLSEYEAKIQNPTTLFA